MAKYSEREVGKEEKSDGLEILSIGSLYNGPWEKKYWSSSRGKDRYPYPVGYQSRRAYNGGAYKLEIHEGPKGPSFVISSADGHSWSGQTPDIACERLQKNFFPRTKAWNGKRFSCKIDGIEFFGFKNLFVQRLLRELMANINGIAEHSLLSSRFCNGAATTVQDNQTPKACTHPDLVFYVESPQAKGNRSKRSEIMNPKSVSTAGFKRFRPGDANYALKPSNSEHSNLKQWSSLLPNTVSSTKEHDSHKLPEASVCLFPVAGGETSPSSIKVGFPLKSVGCSDHLMEKDVPAIEESSLVGSENSNSTTAVCNFPAEEKLPDRSLDAKAEGLNLTMLEEDRAGDAPVPKDTQSVHDIDLCAPDTLDFVQENVTDSAPAQDKSTCSVKEELFSIEATVSEGLVTDSHPEEVIGASISNGGSERSDFDSVGPDIAKSMMTFLLPQAIPLLKKNSRKKRKVLNSSTNVHGTPKPHEKNVETWPFVEAQCPDVYHAVLPGSEHTKSVVLDTFDDDDQCGTPETNQLALSSNSAEADQPCYDMDACLPCRKEQLVNVDAMESSVCDADSSVIKDIFCHDEVQWASSKRPQDGYLYSCESVLAGKSASQNAFSEENQNVGKNLDKTSVGAKVDSGENDCKSAPDFNDAVATSNAIQRGTRASMELSMKDISVKAENAETGNLSQEPKKVYTRKKDPKAASRTRKCNAPFSESIICRNLGHRSIPETTRTLPGSEAFQMSSSVEKPHKNDLCDGEPGGGEQLKDLHLGKASISPKPPVESLSPIISQIQTFSCASEDKDALNPLTPSVPQVEKLQAEDMLVGNQNILNVNSPVTSPKQGTTFSCNRYSVKQVQTNSDLKLQRTLKLDDELEGMVELVGCYFHPMPVLSLLLGTKGDEIYVCTLCGHSVDKNRTLFLYKISVKETRTGCPSYVGHTSVTFPSLTDICGREIALERSGLQLTPDGQHLVLLGNIKTPYCREGRINCLCSTCSSDSFEQSSMKIVQVNTGYVSVLVKLRTVDRLLCTLICEPNHLVAAGESGRMYVWTMNSSWGCPTEEFVISANDSISPCIVELKRIPKCASVIVGHNGFGEFTVWDISKRTFMSRYSSLSASACQFSPISLFNWQREVCGFSYSTVEEHINRIMDATKLWFSENSENYSVHPLDGEDIAIWLLVSTVSELETQCNYVSSDSRINPVGSWRLALLVKNMLILGSALDPRAAAIGTSSGHGIIGTLDGLLYMWELATGTKLGTLHHFKGGSVSCIATDDSRKGVILVACDTGQLVVYRQTQDYCKSMR